VNLPSSSKGSETSASGGASGIDFKVKDRFGDGFGVTGTPVDAVRGQVLLLSQSGA
jgi:hypothetical protein